MCNSCIAISGRQDVLQSCSCPHQAPGVPLCVPGGLGLHGFVDVLDRSTIMYTNIMVTMIIMYTIIMDYQIIMVMIIIR